MEDTQKTYTRRNALPGMPFPDCLRIVPTGEIEPLPRQVISWYVSHNQAVMDYHKSCVGAMHDLRNPERAILALADGIQKWVRLTSYANDGHFGREVTTPLFQAFRAALAGERGRLDGGTLDSWAADMLRELGISPDTYEWL